MAEILLNPKPVHGFKTITPLSVAKIFLSGSDNVSPQEEETLHPANVPVKFIVAMAPGDRMLLERLNRKWRLLEEHQEDEDREELLSHLFWNWEWTYLVSSLVLNSFIDKKDTSARKKTGESRLRSALHDAASFGAGSLMNLFRSVIAQRDNPTFCHNLSQSSIAGVEFVPAPSDSRYWNILAAMFLSLPQEMLFWMNAPARRRLFKREYDYLEWLSGHFSIHVLYHIFDLSKRRSANAQDIGRIFTESSLASELRTTLSDARSETSEFVQYLEDDDSVHEQAARSQYEAVDVLDLLEPISPITEILADVSQVSELSSDRSLQENEFERSMLEEYDDTRAVTDEAPSTPSEELNDRLDVKELSRLIDTNNLSSELLKCALLGTPEWHLYKGSGTSLEADGLRQQLVTESATVSNVTEPQYRYFQSKLSQKIPHLATTEFRRSLLLEPGGYLEVIPWTELKVVAKTDVSASFGHMSILQDLPSDCQFCTYSPKSAMLVDYHFISEFEVHQYRLEHNFVSLGHAMNGEVLFVRRPLDKTLFNPAFKYYWLLWNDCKITEDPTEGQLFLLSTVPGERYREAYAKFEHRGALTLFRKEIDEHLDHLEGRLNERTNGVRDRIFGIDHDPILNNLLKCIPASELRELSSIDLGAGSYGSVRTAQWHRSPSLEFRDRGLQVPVVLKKLHERHSHPSEDLKMFVKELQMSYLGLFGGGSNCTALYGITEIPWDPPAPFSNFGDSSPSLCLVFERATEGLFWRTPMELIQTERWDVVTDLLTGVFGGLSDLHKRDILHCDIHPGNILLTTRVILELDEPGDRELSVRVCDFGRCKAVTEQAPWAFSNLPVATKYKAPELVTGGSHTKATDVYAAGVFLFDILALAARHVSSSNAVLVPRELWKLCQECMRQDASQRPKAIEACRRLEDLRTYTYSKNSNYNLIDLRSILRQTRTNFPSSGSQADGTDRAASLESMSLDNVLSYQTVVDSLDRFD